MKIFADNSARTWAITVNVAAVKRVRELLQVNLLEIADQKGKLLERLVDDPCLLCDILFCLVKPEADAKGDQRRGLRPGPGRRRLGGGDRRPACRRSPIFSPRAVARSSTGSSQN